MSVRVATFADVVAAARAGEGWAFDQLFTDWNAPITGFVRARGVTDVDGVVNDIFLKAFQAVRGFDGSEAEFRSWIFRIARNRTIDEFRRQARQPTLVELDSARGFSGGDVVTDADKNMGDDRVVSLLAHLTEEQREVLTLRIVADLTIDQIASITGRRRGAVKQLQRRALRRLEAILEGEAP